MKDNFTLADMFEIIGDLVKSIFPIHLEDCEPLMETIASMSYNLYVELCQKSCLEKILPEPIFKEFQQFIHGYYEKDSISH